jgi:type I restriction enzyme, S subunit
MYNSVKVSEFLHRVKVPVELQPEQEYSLVTIKVHHKGVVLRNKTKGKLIGSKMYRISKGQFILSGIDARNGAFGIVPDELDGAIVTNDFWYFDIDETKVKRDFFYWLTNTPLFLNACIKSSQGVTQRIRLQRKLFFNFEFRFPPLEEQENFLKRIQHADQGLILLRVELQKQEKYISQLKQAILQEAIAGQLTAEWRDRNPMQKGNPDTDAAALLAKIKAEKRQLIADGKLKKEKPLPEISPDEIPFSLPDSWVWCRLGEIIKENPRNGYSPKAVSYPTSVKTLKLGATTWGKFNPDEYKYIDEQIPSDSIFWLKQNDILIQRSNSLDYVGVSAIYDGEDNQFIYPDLMIKVQMMQYLSINFSYLLLSSPMTRTYFRNLAKGAQKSMPKITQGVVLNTLFPLPPVAEQKAIVEKVDYLMKIIDQLEEQIKHRKQLAEDLMQTVLREAFE